MPWKFDPYHLQVEFAVKHFGMMTVRGHFTQVDASGTLDPDSPHLSSLDVTITSARFEGLGRVARHRLVYDALHSLMPRGIHALAIDARVPQSR